MQNLVLILIFTCKKIEIKVYTANIKIRLDLHHALQLDEFYIEMIFLGDYRSDM